MWSGGSIRVCVSGRILVYVCVCAQQPGTSLSLRQPQIADQTQRQHCALNLFLPAGRSSNLESLVEILMGGK